MSAPPSRADAAGRAYNDLRNKARAAHRPTQELLQLYLLEAFLRRLAGSSHRENLVLKGGVLLAALATANLKFAVDVSVGDPIEPGPQRVLLPCLLTDETIELVGYPIVMVHAEKLVTALQRGTVSTRWRDFADIWTLSRHWDCDGNELTSALVTVADYRDAPLEPLFPALEGYAELAQERWSLWRAKLNLDTPLPEQFADILTDIARFADPAMLGEAAGKTWKADAETWQ